MKRIDKIYNHLKEKTSKLTLEEIEQGRGFTASEIAEELGMLRNNVSMELNELIRQDKVIKLKGRPVLYLDKVEGERLSSHKLIFQQRKKDKKEEKSKESPFDLIIGARGSLKNQIEQAKAAVLYPPNGLHTLILGPTGVGKTLFANMMFSYAKHIGKLKEESPFIVFNCADYYNNPQLLISQIFGHVKSAFTGAEGEKSGLVEKANGGILFLDEIHRLPPEGQEMIFYFMDTGTFNKLGETERNRKSSVMIICATTEDPNSSLLKTFVRRIPIIINIPSLEERPISERVDIIKHLLSKEAMRVNKPIKVSGDVIKALVGSVSYGNIGQLKSNIQLICAKGFLNSIENKEQVYIDFKTLPSNIKGGILDLGARRKELEEISPYLDSDMVIRAEGNLELVKGDTYEPPFNLYKIIEDKASILKDEGVDEEYIKKFITTDINLHIKSFYDKFNINPNSKEKLLKIVDEEILDLAEDIKSLAEKRLNKRFSHRFLYAISLHVSAFLKRMQEDTPLKKYANNIESIMKENPEEYRVALEIKALIQGRYNILVPDMEVVYLTLLLTSIDDNQKSEDTQKIGNVGVIVAAHGSSTASSMVNVAIKLLGDYNVKAIDMSLDISPKNILKDIIDIVKEIDMGKGVLILVDMGSLTTFGAEIEENTGIKVKTIDMVSTPIVLEAVRKANVFDMDLDSIYNSLKSFKGYGRYQEANNRSYDKAIITICSTGEGTAVKLKGLVQDVIENITEEYINIIPIGIHNLKEDVEKLKNKYDIMASVGVIDPKLEVPFIPLEDLIEGSGEKVIKDLVSKNHIKIIQKETKVIAKDLCEDSLKQFLTYLNPYKVTPLVLNFITRLEKGFAKEFNNSMIIRLSIHTACALERMVTKEYLTYASHSKKINSERLIKIRKAAEIFKDSLNLELTENELYYISDILEEE